MSREEDAACEEAMLRDAIAEAHAHHDVPDFDEMWAAAEDEVARGRAPVVWLVAALALLALGGAVWSMGGYGASLEQAAPRVAEVDHDRPSPLPFDADSVRVAEELAELESWDAPTDFLLEEPIAESRLLFEEAPEFGVPDELVF